MPTVCFLRPVFADADILGTKQGQMLDNVRKALMGCRLSFGLASFKEPGWVGGLQTGPFVLVR